MSIVTQKVLVADWLISFAHMRKMLAALRKPKHRAFGFYAEFEELGSNLKTFSNGVVVDFTSNVFSDYADTVTGGRLKIYRDIRVKRVPAESMLPALTPMHIDAKTFMDDEIRVLKALAKGVLDAEGILARAA